MNAKRNTEFRIKGNGHIRFVVTRTVGDTIYYRLADKPQWMYSLMGPASQITRERFDEIAIVVRGR